MFFGVDKTNVLSFIVVCNNTITTNNIHEQDRLNFGM